jgi:hyperosmotically inducible periplasmic protein
MQTPTLRRSAALALPLCAALSLLAACDRRDERTLGQKTDQAVASAERKADEVAADARQAGREARQAVTEAADTVANKSRDAAITAEVKARLARDTQLSALAINVDTDGGRVVLRGSAPDSGSRGRATELARGVDGVVSVDNDLSVRTN